MLTPEELRRFHYFDSLDGDQLQAVAVLAETVDVRENEPFFFEGQPADALFLVADGSVDLYHNVEAPGAAHARATEAVYQLMEEGAAIPMLEGQSRVLAEWKVGEIGAGEIVGMSAIIPPHRLTATARASRPSRLIKIDAVALRRAGEREPLLMNRLLTATAQVAMARLNYARSRLIAAIG